VRDVSTENCTIARAMTILGERWTLVVLREISLGVRRFGEIRERTGMPRQVLADRLRQLVDDGILRRVPYQEQGARQRAEYRLTEKGFGLFPVLVAVREWGDRYLADPDGPPVLTVHKDCGEPVAVTLRCAAGHEVSQPRDLRGRPGPGARPRRPTPVAATSSPANR
jgi:DNA-binding HxlR family transcriptional regulator